MKTNIQKTVGWWLVVVLLLATSPLSVLADPVDYITVTGVVKDKQNKKVLGNVNVSVPGTSLGTVTNADGMFSLKIKKELQAQKVEMSHIGYYNSQITLSNEANLSGLVVWMVPHTNILNEVVVYANAPRLIVEEAIKKIPQNYSIKENLFTAFYRETVQKGKRYISISEAVINLYKTSYLVRETDNDKVQIEKGRRLMSPKVSDTIAVKVVGGPNLSIYLDIVKNSYAMLNANDLQNYDFMMEEPVTIDNRVQYVVQFRPRVTLEYALYYGKLFIDRETLSFTRSEFNLDLENKAKAIQAILYRKPLGLRFKPMNVSFLVTYKNEGGKTYLNYIQNLTQFKCDWKRRLFSSTYSVLTEMVVTDRKEDNFAPISRKDAFDANQIFYDKVDKYWNEDFWGGYNIIEPTESLENAVNKLRKQSR